MLPNVVCVQCCPLWHSANELENVWFLNVLPGKIKTFCRKKFGVGEGRVQFDYFAPHQMDVSKKQAMISLQGMAEFKKCICLSCVFVRFLSCLWFPCLWTSFLRPTRKGWLPLMCVGLNSHAVNGTFCIQWWGDSSDNNSTPLSGRWEQKEVWTFRDI